ncbi:hypothetical protein [Dactylosporangium sp. NPDC049140]|uniref:hypothetical protein n=1 Tax=Dactylosporangium sp. NPDC049140 TaxID=3155647 RepID=UPI0033CEF525
MAFAHVHGVPAHGRALLLEQRHRVAQLLLDLALVGARVALVGGVAVAGGATPAGGVVQGRLRS